MGFSFLDAVAYLAIQGVQDRKREKKRETKLKNEQAKIKAPPERNNIMFIYHFRRMEDIVKQLKKAVLAQDGEAPDTDTFFEFFIYGILFDLVNKSHCNSQVKAEMLNRAIELSTIKGELSGYDIYESVENSTDASELMIYTTNTEGEQYGLWGLIVLLANRTNRDEDSLNFVKECVDFLVGIESALYKEYPDAGFGDFARQYMLEKTAKIRERFFND